LVGVDPVINQTTRKRGSEVSKRIGAGVALLVASLTLLVAGPASASANTDFYAGYSKVGYGSSGIGGSWNIYEGYSKVGSISRSGSKWKIDEGYSSVGYTSMSGNKWTCYAGYSKVGYVSLSTGTKWNIYAGYSKVGYASGANAGPVGCAALVLGLI
jgi:hypothetical protein